MAIEYQYKFIGRLKSGASVYIGQDGKYAVEKDLLHLVEPTPGEAAEIQILQGRE